jgi:PPP family 3-phenylpropionic acid transporter
MFCFYSLSPIGDSMYVEYAQRHKLNYGKGRMWGSIGLAVLPMVPGLIISRAGIRMLFPVYLGMLVLCAVSVLIMPKMEGGQSKSGKKLNLLALRKDKELAGLIIFLFLLHTTLGFYYSFFPVHMNNLGATDLISVNNLLQFCSEIVFVYFVTRLIRRFGFLCSPFCSPRSACC